MITICILGPVRAFAILETEAREVHHCADKGAFGYVSATPTIEPLGAFSEFLKNSAAAFGLCGVSNRHLEGVISRANARS